MLINSLILRIAGAQLVRGDRIEFFKLSGRLSLTSGTRKFDSNLASFPPFNFSCNFDEFKVMAEFCFRNKIEHPVYVGT